MIYASTELNIRSIVPFNFGYDWWIFYDSTYNYNYEIVLRLSSRDCDEAFWLASNIRRIYLK